MVVLVACVSPRGCGVDPRSVQVSLLVLEHLSVPCTERALLCLLNGGVGFVCFNELPLLRGQRLPVEDVPQLELAGLGPVPQPLPLTCPVTAGK